MLTIHSKTNGDISVSLKAIASIAGNAACECYGVLGLASKNPLKDHVNDILGINDSINGVSVKYTNKGFELNMYIIVAYGVKITEVVSEVQKKVRYVLKKALDINFTQANIYVQGIRSL